MMKGKEIMPLTYESGMDRWYARGWNDGLNGIESISRVTFKPSPELDAYNMGQRDGKDATGSLTVCGCLNYREHGKVYTCPRHYDGY
jgi:hypothetical protein